MFVMSLKPFLKPKSLCDYLMIIDIGINIDKLNKKRFLNIFVILESVF